MATYISLEQRAKILSAIKDEGMSIVDAAKTFLVTEDAIKKWMRKQSRNSHTSSTEVQRLKHGQDEYYTYYGLSRLSTLKRGTLNAGHTGLTTTPTWEEDFNFDETGNWHGSTTGYKTLVNGSTTLDQNRSNSKANEISGFTTNSGTAWAAPAYDSNGNATSIPKPSALANSYTCVYDGWNRLMSVKSGSTTVANYRYDGRVNGGCRRPPAPPATTTTAAAGTWSRSG